MRRDEDTRSIIDILGDEYAREILVLLHARPMTVQDLADRCQASPSTIYRRIHALQELNLVEERIQFDDEQNQANVFESKVENVQFDFTDEGIRINVTYRSDMSRKFEDFWEELDSE